MWLHAPTRPCAPRLQVEQHAALARSFAGSQPGGPSASLAELHAVVHVSQEAEIAKTKLMLAKQ
eukprot:7387270-Prymnesium_polylepis.1